MSILAKFGGSPPLADDQKQMSFWGEVVRQLGVGLRRTNQISFLK
jgi:hypothetical protein